MITENGSQTLELKALSNGAVGLVEKNRIDGEWIAKVTILNKREALAIANEITRIYREKE